MCEGRVEPAHAVLEERGARALAGGAATPAGSQHGAQGGANPADDAVRPSAATVLSRCYMHPPCASLARKPSSHRGGLCSRLSSRSVPPRPRAVTRDLAQLGHARQRQRAQPAEGVPPPPARGACVVELTERPSRGGRCEAAPPPARQAARARYAPRPPTHASRALSWGCGRRRAQGQHPHAPAISRRSPAISMICRPPSHGAEATIAPAIVTGHQAHGRLEAERRRDRWLPPLDPRAERRAGYAGGATRLSLCESLAVGREEKASGGVN